MIRGSEDGWSVVVDGFHVEQNRAIEGLFTLGSGYLHIRGSLEEHFDDDPQNVDFMRLPTNVTSEKFRATKAKWGTYVPGIYGRHPLLGNELINLPSFIGIHPFVDSGSLWNFESSLVAPHVRILDLARASLARRISHESALGTVTHISFERFISAARPGVCVQRAIVTVEANTSIWFDAGIDADVRTNGIDHFVDVRIDAADERTIVCVAQTDRAEYVSVASRGAVRGAEFGPVTVSGGRQGREFGIGIEGRRASLVTEAPRIEPSNTTTFEKRTGVAVSGEARSSHAIHLLDGVEGLSYEQLFAEHAAVWKGRWDSCDVEIDGDSESQLAIRVALYHLLRCHVDDSRVAIDAKGYSGDAYWGRFFWDTEMFLLPFYLYTAPQKAHTLVDFRVNTLPGARRNAARYGYPGARYAWESDPEGDECCPNWQYADHEVHVTADVVYGLVHFAAATADEAYLRGAAADVLIETARYWMGRIDWRKNVAADPRVGRSSAKGEPASGNLANSRPTADTGVGRYISAGIDRDVCRPVLLGVMGPDEYTPISDNNAITNRMVAFALERAALVAEHCSRSSGTSSEHCSSSSGTQTGHLTDADHCSSSGRATVTAEEIAAWREVSAGLPIPRHPDNPLLVLQCDGFERLAEPRFEEFWKDRDKTFASQVSQERLYRSKCLKQADVLMLMALFPHEFSDQEVRAAWDYYLPYTTHDSSLSPGVHALIACRLGLDEEAWDFWKRACAVDLDIERGGAAEGVHIANFGAMWQIVVFGYAGVRTALQSEQFTLNPRLPEKWTALRFPLVWKGTPVRIEIDRGGVRVSNRGEHAIDVCVRGDTRSIQPAQTGSWDTPR